MPKQEGLIPSAIMPNAKANTANHRSLFVRRFASTPSGRESSWRTFHSCVSREISLLDCARACPSEITLLDRLVLFMELSSCSQASFTASADLVMHNLDETFSVHPQCDKPSYLYGRWEYCRWRAAWCVTVASNLYFLVPVEMLREN